MQLLRRFGQQLHSNWILLCLVLGFICLHSIFLDRLPIFNDESIYLDWAWSALHIPGHAFDSLLDAKQPLMIWVWGIFELFIDSPVIAGRFASIVIGSLTAVGIYTIAQRLFDKKSALLAFILYSITPIFVFYHRIALMEMSVACVGIWTYVVLTEFIASPSRRKSAILGCLLGIGFLIKSSAVIFAMSSSLIIAVHVIQRKNWQILRKASFSLVTFMTTTYIVLIQPYFWHSFRTNDRFTYTLRELLHFPVHDWLIHGLGFIEIGLVFMTPLLFLEGLFGLRFINIAQKESQKIFVHFFAMSLLLEIVLVRTQSQRYLVAFLPFLTILAARTVTHFWEQGIFFKAVASISVIFPLYFYVLQLFQPQLYILQLARFSQYSELGYLFGQTSGYGINECLNFIAESTDSTKPTLVFFAQNAGNPESAVDLFTQKHPNFYGLYIDAAFFPDLAQTQCLSTNYPVFFVTRSVELAGMERFFELAKKCPNPHDQYYVGVYTLKKSCEGNTLSLSDKYQPVIEKMTHK